MPPSQISLLTARGEAFAGVLPDRLQQPETLAGVAEQALVDE